MGHIPVLLPEVIEALQPAAGEAYCDGTFGGGGYALAVLKVAECTLYGIDRDLDAIERAETLARKHSGLIPLLGRFGDLDALLLNNGVEAVDGVMLDIGVSSFQIDQAGRGFSFMRDGPLDMRMGQTGPSAGDVINLMAEGDLTHIIRALGEERQARRIAKSICERRIQKPFTTTHDLAAQIEAA